MVLYAGGSIILILILILILLPTRHTFPIPISPLPNFLSLRSPYLMATVVAPSLQIPVEALPNPLSILPHPDLTFPNPSLFLRPPLQEPSHPPLSHCPFDSTPRAINGAYATFTSKDDYLPGALVLEEALRGVSRPAYIMLRFVLVPNVQSNP